MKKLFKWLLVLAGALTIGIAIILFKPGLIKGPLENYLSKVTGYSISLDGTLEIEVGRHSSITATDVRVAGMAGGGASDLITLGGLSLKLDLASLFDDVIVIESLQVDDLKLNPQTNTEGLGNWLPVPAKTPPGDAATRGSVVIIRDISVSNARVRYLNGETGTVQVLQIDRLHQSQKDSGLLHINLGGSLNQRPLEFTGSFGPYANLLKGRDVRFSGSGHFGSLDIVAKGLIDDLAGPERPEFNIKLQGPNIDEITAMFGTEDLGTGQFSLVARGREVDDRYEADVHGNVGNVSVALSARASDLLQVDRLDLKVALNGPSLGALTRTFGIDHWPDKPFNLKGDIRRDGNTLDISGLKLGVGGAHLTLDALLSNFPSLEAGRIRLSIQGDDVKQFRNLLGIPGIASGPFEVNGSLDVSADAVELIQVELKTSVGQATISGTLGSAPGYIGTKLHVHLDGLNANEFISAFGIDALPEQPFSLDAHIERTENGLLIERGVVVSIEDDRLELGGLIAFNPGGEGTDIEVSFSGEDLPELLNRVVGEFEIPAEPYELSGRVLLQQGAIKLQNVRAGFEDIKLTGDGVINLDERLEGTDFNFQIEGNDLSKLKKFPAIGNSLDVFEPGPFETSGQFVLSAGQLAIREFEFETVNAHGKMDLEFGWPFTDSMDIGFDVNISGDDIRQWLPGMELFEPAEAAFSIEATGQHRHNLLSLQKLDATIGKLQVLLKGKVDIDPSAGNVALSFSASSPDLSKLGQLNGEPLPVIALDISAGLTGASHRFGFHNLDVTLGDSHLTGSVDVSLEGIRPKIDMAITAEYIDTRPFVGLSESDDQSTPQKSKSRLIPATPLPLEAMSSFDGTFNIEADELRLENDSLHDIVLQATLLDGHLEIPRLSLKGPRGRLQTSLSINPTTEANALVTVDLLAEKLILNITGQPDDKLDEAPPFDLVIRASGTGSNLQEVASSLNGSLFLGSTGGALEGVNLSVLDTFILDEIFALVMPKSDTKDDLDLRCVAAILEITNGRVNTNPAVTFITSEITLVSKGSVNLKTEEMKLNFTATPNNALKISASELFNPYILVSGTLSEPSVGLDPTKALLHGGAAIGTAGISILAKGLLDRISTTIPLCEDMLNSMRQK